MRFQSIPILAFSFLLSLNGTAQNWYFYKNDSSPGINGESRCVGMNVAKEGIYLVESYYKADSTKHYLIKSFDHDGRHKATRLLPHWTWEQGEVQPNGDTIKYGIENGVSDMQILNSETGFYVYFKSILISKEFGYLGHNEVVERYQGNLQERRMYKHKAMRPAGAAVSDDHVFIFGDYFPDSAETANGMIGGNTLVTFDTSGQLLSRKQYAYSGYNRFTQPVFLNDYIYVAEDDYAGFVSVKKFDTNSDNWEHFDKLFIDKSGFRGDTVYTLWSAGSARVIAKDKFEMGIQLIIKKDNRTTYRGFSPVMDENCSVLRAMPKGYASNPSIMNDSTTLFSGESAIQFNDGRTMNLRKTLLLFHKGPDYFHPRWQKRYTDFSAQYHAASNRIILAGTAENRIEVSPDSSYEESHAFLAFLGADGVPLVKDDDLKWTVQDHVSVPQPQRAVSSVQLYPNPASDKLFMDGQIETFTSYSIYSLSGALIEREMLVENEIMIKHLPRGLYILQLKSPERISTLRFVKE